MADLVVYEVNITELGGDLERALTGPGAGAAAAGALLLLQSLGPLPVARRAAFTRYDDSDYTLVAINTTDAEQTVPFWFPIDGDYAEELHGGDVGLKAVVAH